MKKTTTFNVFLKLQQKNNSADGYYIAAPLPCNSYYKIGVSKDGYPTFFVPSTVTSFSIDINMEMITILFGRVCKIHEIKNTEGVYTIITLKTGDYDIQKYFIDIVSIILEQLPPNYSDTTLAQEIQKLVNLFSLVSQPPRKTIQGLWAELFVIERAKNPEYLIQTWHITPNDRYDFNDGTDKIEVKSTVRPQKVHRFSLEQLHPNNSSHLIIASVNTELVGQGVNIFALRDSICNKVQDLRLQFYINEIIIKTIGSEITKVSELYFDYTLAVDTLAYFDVHDIPTIAAESIPKELTNIHFDCDMSDIESLSLSAITQYNSQLLNCLGL